VAASPPDANAVADLLARATDGDRAALARLLSWVERGGDGAREVARAAFPKAGGAHTVGITGAPGAGKSTLTNALCGQVRAAGEQVAVLAIDPSSPFTGGAILGDRVRMGDHTLDEGVFIRSMATRGHLGGLSLATPEAARVLDAVGYRWVVVETVGVGQVEVDIAGAADTTVVVVNPGWGDAVQANKAGLMEIADLFVINKADRVGTALIGHIEPGQHVGSVQQRPHLLQFARADLVLTDAHPVHPCRGAAQRLQTSRVGGQADVTDGIEPGGVAGLGLEALIEVA
jgi:putative protein kinase ArgK-like GTPase of G3E family